jgi:hypothetical protein
MIPNTVQSVLQLLAHLYVLTETFSEVSSMY